MSKKGMEGIKILSQYFSGGTEENHETPQSR
jgi:hypothetical protein